MEDAVPSAPVGAAVGGGPGLAGAIREAPRRECVELAQGLADAILFLLGDESAHVTGTELTVDGGRGAD